MSATETNLVVEVVWVSRGAGEAKERREVIVLTPPTSDEESSSSEEEEVARLRVVWDLRCCGMPKHPSWMNHTRVAPTKATSASHEVVDLRARE